MTKSQELRAFRRATIVLTLLWGVTTGTLIVTFIHYDDVERVTIRKTACRLKAPEMKVSQEKCESFLECTQKGNSPKKCLTHLF